MLRRSRSPWARSPWWVCALGCAVALPAIAQPAVADAPLQDPAEALRAKKVWTRAELKQAAEADPPGELFRPSTRVEDAYELDETFVVPRGCEQTWSMATAEDPEQLSILFGENIAEFRRTETFDDGYRAQIAESLMGFTSDVRESRFIFDEGDPARRVGEAKAIAEDDPTWVRYTLLDVGQPDFCLMRMQVLVTFPVWIPDFAIGWMLGFDAGALADSVRDGLRDQPAWPANQQAPLITDKGRRERDAWQVAQRAAEVPPAVVQAAPRPASAPSTVDGGVAEVTFDGGAP